MTHSNQWLQERADLLATLTEWRERAEAAEAENIEHARLLGMGAERELALLARAEAAEANLLKAEGLLADAYGADSGMLDLACRAEAAEAKVTRLTEALAAARPFILEEAARIADRHAAHGVDLYPDDADAMTAREIAAAIRAAKETGE